MVFVELPVAIIKRGREMPQELRSTEVLGNSIAEQV